MNPELCEFEDALSAAFASGQWNDALRRHLAICPTCREHELVWRYLESLPPLAETLPSPGLIWWRAQLAERRDQAARGVAAIELMQKVAIAVALSSLMAVGWFWQSATFTIGPSAILIGASMLLATAVVLYGWARGKI